VLIINTDLCNSCTSSGYSQAKQIILFDPYLTTVILTNKSHSTAKLIESFGRNLQKVLKDTTAVEHNCAKNPLQNYHCKFINGQAQIIAFPSLK
jgi:hypothetical protein